MTWLLASWLVTQTWTWYRSTDTDVVSYRIYWGASGIAWCQAHRVEIPATNCDATMCWGDVPQPDFSPAFFIVTSVDASGNESATEHGNVVVCP